ARPAQFEVGHRGGRWRQRGDRPAIGCQWCHGPGGGKLRLQPPAGEEGRDPGIALRRTLLAGGYVQVHRLDADPSRTGEAVPDHVAATAEDAGFQPEHLHVHADAFIAVDPAAWFDVDLLVLGQFLLENVAVAVQPEDTFLAARAEAVDE